MEQTLLRPAAVLLLLLTLLTGFAYPLLITIEAYAFGHERHGSVLYREDQAIGSQLIGQAFSDPKYLWGRPSATTPQPYNASASGGSNLGPSNPALLEAVTRRVAALHAADPENHALIPVDLVTASASGLDPEISVAAANYQIARIARARRLAPQAIADIVAAHTTARVFGFLGEPRVNVLAVNLALDAASNVER